MRTLLKWLASYKRKVARRRHNAMYEYGWVYCIDKELGIASRSRARRKRGTNKVYRVLWRAGEQGHLTNWWEPYGDGWIAQFRPDSTCHHPDCIVNCVAFNVAWYHISIEGMIGAKKRFIKCTRVTGKRGCWRKWHREIAKRGMHEIKYRGSEPHK